jgi:hypothetical protein
MRVKYRGHLPRVSIPGDATSYVKPGEAVEVDDALCESVGKDGEKQWRLGSNWEKAAARKKGVKSDD